MDLIVLPRLGKEAVLLILVLKTLTKPNSPIWGIVRISESFGLRKCTNMITLCITFTSSIAQVVGAWA